MSLVSVIIPVYNGEKYLRAALDSALDQAHLMEVIVVDDDSTDGTAELAMSYGGGIRYYRQRKGGAGAARNLGVRMARGTHLAFLDADDIWTAGKLEDQIAVLAAHPELDMVFGCVTEFLDQGGRVDPASVAPTEGRYSGYIPGTMLIRREAFLRVGFFDVKWRVGEFIDWYTRAREVGLRGDTLPRVLMLRRIHGGNTGIRCRDAQVDYVRVVKASLDRQRQKRAADRG